VGACVPSFAGGVAPVGGGCVLNPPAIFGLAVSPGARGACCVSNVPPPPGGIAGPDGGICCASKVPPLGTVPLKGICCVRYEDRVLDTFHS